MKRRRSPHCRQPFIVPVVTDTPSSSDERPGRQIIEEAIRGFVDIGREMIGAGVAAIVDTATTHGFSGPEWDADAIRPAIIEIIAPRMHAVLVEVMRPDRPSLTAEAGWDVVRQNATCKTDKLKNALAEQLYAIVETEFQQYGLNPEIRHVTRLRECLSELVADYGSVSLEPGADTHAKTVPLIDTMQVANTVIPLLRYGESERDRE